MLIHNFACVMPSSLNTHWHKRRVIATPPWASMAQIKKIYDQARYMSMRTGTMHTVDHIIPLNHAKVCGLHVHWNLQVMTRIDGDSKGNFWRSDWDA